MDLAKEKTAIIYGLGDNGKKAYSYLSKRYNIIGCSDSNLSQKKGELAAKVPFFSPLDLKKLEFDYVLVTSVYGEEIFRYLTKDIGVPSNKILLREEWCRIPFLTSYGDKNPDKTFYVMSKEIRIKNGLLSLAFSVLEQLVYVEEKGYIPVVDLQSYPNQYLEPDKLCKENAWEYYYEPLSSYSLDEVYSSKNVVLGYDDPCYQEDYSNNYNIKRMSELYKKYIHVRKDLLKKIDEEYILRMGAAQNVLGVLYRGTDMNALKLEHHPIQPSISELICQSKRKYKEWACDKIFLSTEDEEAIRIFKNVFGKDVVYTDQLRYSNTGKNWLSDINNKRENDRYLRGEEYLTTIAILSRCNSLISGVSAGSVMSIIMNNNGYQHVYIIDKGVYAR
ncbi:MAG: hypothetical protein ACI4GW_13225 [Lachnospiraceae bacterium]